MLVKVQKLRKTFQQKELFHSLSFELREDQLLLLTGSNGSGKSTLLKILVGLIDPDSGEVQNLSDRPMAYAPASEHDFIPNTSMKENLLFFAKIYNAKNIKKNMEKLCQDFQVSRYLNTAFQELSSGNKKKFSIIRALMMESKVLLFDEVMGPLDQRARVHLYTYLKRWCQQQGAACLLTSHNLQDDYLISEEKLSLDEALY